MSDNEYGNVVIKFKSCENRADLYVRGCRVVSQNGMFMLYGEAGPTFMIPESSIQHAFLFKDSDNVTVNINGDPAYASDSLFDLRKEKNNAESES